MNTPNIDREYPVRRDASSERQQQFEHQVERSKVWTARLLLVAWVAGLLLAMMGTTGCEATAGLYVENDVYTDFAVPGKPDMRTSLKLELKDSHFLERKR